MKSAFALALTTAAALVLVAGCPDYTSEEPPPDATAPVDAVAFDSSSSSTSSSSSSGEAGASTTSSSSSGMTTPGYPPACDPSVDVNAIDCGSATRAICGSQLTVAPAGIAGTDLIECDSNGKPTCVRRCTMGCAALGNSLPSQCANCKDPTAADIWYCGKDIGFSAAARDVVIRCSGGQLSIEGSPTAVCGPNLCHTVCTRTSPPPKPGSCCQTTPE